MSGLIGKKIGMTSVYSAEGKNIPCTVIEAGPCVVTQIKTVEKDTYEAVQIAYDDKSEKHTSNSLLGHFKKAGTTPKRKMAEFKDMPEVNLGDTLTVEMFSEEDWVDVTGISKGKGFQGVVKRHGFGGVGGQTQVSTTVSVSPVHWVLHLIRHAYSRASVWLAVWVAIRLRFLT